MQSSPVAGKVTSEGKGEAFKCYTQILRGKEERDDLVYLCHHFYLKVKHGKEVKVGHM